jgi:hypothetical protein
MIAIHETHPHAIDRRTGLLAVGMRLDIWLAVGQRVAAAGGHRTACAGAGGVVNQQHQAVTSTQLLWRIAGLLLAALLVIGMIAWLGRAGAAISGLLFTLAWLIRKFPVASLIIMLLLGGHR